MQRRGSPLPREAVVSRPNAMRRVRRPSSRQGSRGTRARRTGSKKRRVSAQELSERRQRRERRRLLLRTQSQVMRSVLPHQRAVDSGGCVRVSSPEQMAVLRTRTVSPTLGHRMGDTPSPELTRAEEREAWEEEQKWRRYVARREALDKDLERARESRRRKEEARRESEPDHEALLRHGERVVGAAVDDLLEDLEQRSAWQKQYRRQKWEEGVYRVIKKRIGDVVDSQLFDEVAARKRELADRYVEVSARRPVFLDTRPTYADEEDYHAHDVPQVLVDVRDVEAVDPLTQSLREQHDHLRHGPRPRHARSGSESRTIAVDPSVSGVLRVSSVDPYSRRPRRPRTRFSRPSTRTDDWHRVMLNTRFDVSPSPSPTPPPLTAPSAAHPSSTAIASSTHPSSTHPSSTHPSSTHPSSTAIAV